MCARLLEPSAFALKSLARDQPYTHCRDCQAQLSREHYQRNRAKYIARAAARNAAIIKLNRERVRDLLANSACTDCGIRNASVLEFDHREPLRKSAEISRPLQTARSWARITSEIAKCDVVCANCHRRRTAREFGWAKCFGLGELTLPPLPARGVPRYEGIKNRRKMLRRRHRNASALLAYLSSHPCSLCGESDAVVLDFDHVGQKRADVSQMWPRLGLSTVLNEISNCRVLCANCHRRHTAQVAGRLR